MRSSRLFLALLMLFAGLTALGPRPAAAQDQDDPDWQAQWIGLPTSATTNIWTCYRKTFTLGEDHLNVIRARVAVDSKYWMWINGQQVVIEGGLKRGPNPSDTWFDELDLTRWLKPGKNTIAILTTYWGVSGFSHNSSGKAGLLFEADLDLDQKVLSDASWKALIHPAYGLAAVQPNERISERNICFDARQDLGAWWKPEFDDSAWKAPEQYGRPPAAPWNKLWKRPIPQWRSDVLRPYVNDGKKPREGNGSPIVMQLPLNMQVTPYMKIVAPAGLKIELRTDHKTVNYPCVYAEYITREGEQEFEVPGWMNGQVVEYVMPKGIRILDLQFRSSGYNAQHAGLFRCNEPFYNTLWTRARDTLYINMRDNYFDCPDRERALWWGDLHIDLGMVPYSLGRSADLLTRKSIYDLVRWQRPDKSLHAPVPGMYKPELPAQMLASIGQYGFWTYYVNTGDKATIADAWPHVKDYLSLWKTGPDGLVLHRGKEAATPDGPIWDWMDWGKDIDARLLDQGWYCLALQGAANMARLLGETAEAEKYEKQRQAVIAATNKNFWNGSAYRDPAYKDATDDRGNALAVAAGIAGPDKFEALRKVLATERHASPYMEKYCLEALFLMGATDEALDRMRQRFEPIMPAGLTTLPEHWDYKAGSLNHAWSGGPLTLLSQYVAGAAPTAPGWESYEIKPRLGAKLNEVTCQFVSPKGAISVQLARQDKSFSLSLVSPTGAAASVYVPKLATPYKTIRANGTIVWSRDGVVMDVLQGVKAVGEDDRYIKFSAEPGEWNFSATTD